MHPTPAAALASALLLWPALGAADQPVFDEMPRWAGGWGVQAMHEARQTGADADQWIHLEGVYTWRRWIRLTAKVPMVIRPDAGLGTPTLALPLKRYFNLDGRSGSWTITPHWMVPAHSSISARSPLQGGLSFGYATETYGPLGSASVGAFRRLDGRFEVHLNAAVGRNMHRFGSSGHIKLKVDLQWRDDGAHRLRAGPIFYWRFNDRWHAQIIYLGAVAEDGYRPKTSLRSGIAAVF